jgi:hypothetical protein
MLVYKSNSISQKFSDLQEMRELWVDSDTFEEGFAQDSA